MWTWGVAAAAEPDRLALEAARAPASAIVSAAAASGSDLEPWIRTLGRLRHADALPYLARIVTESADVRVRAAAAEALGRTPGSAAALRLALEAEGDVGVRSRLVDALGRQGDSQDVDRLARATEGPGVEARAALVALGRMGRRGVTGLGPGQVAAARALTRKSLEHAAAFALFRIGLADVDAGLMDEIRAAKVADPMARAWVLRALWPVSSADERVDAFIAGVTDSSRRVRVAAFDAVGAGDVPVDLIAPALRAKDPWVQAAALGALGRLEDEAADRVLLERIEDPNPYRAAAAVAALGRPDRVRAASPDLHPVVRAAWVAQETDLEALLRAATEDPSSLVRVAAADAVAGRPMAAGAAGMRLLASPDPVVHEVAYAILAERGDAEAARAIPPLVAAEKEPEAFHQGLVAVAALSERHPSHARNPLMAELVARGGKSPEARTRDVALRLATHVGVTAPSPPAPAENQVPRDVFGAVVFTTAGVFVLDLDPEVAPMAVARFASLADANTFDGLAFHRVVPGFVVQTGDPRGDGWGAAGSTLPDEVSLAPFESGALGMARSDYDSGASQWFVTTGHHPHLDGDYTYFGHVVAGQAVVDRIGVGDAIVDVVIERRAAE